MTPRSSGICRTSVIDQCPYLAMYVIAPPSLREAALVDSCWIDNQGQAKPRLVLREHELDVRVP